MPWGAPEIPKKKWSTWLKAIGINSPVFRDKKNEPYVIYEGQKIGFSLTHKKEAMKVSYISNIILRKLLIDGYTQQNPKYKNEFDELRKRAKKITGY